MEPQAKSIFVPGVGDFEFPATMDDATINSHIETFMRSQAGPDPAKESPPAAPPPDPGFAVEAIHATGRAIAHGTGSIMKNVSVAGRELDRVFGNERPLEEYAFHKMGSDVQRTGEGLFPRPPGAKGGFLREDLPGAIGSTIPFLGPP